MTKSRRCSPESSASRDVPRWSCRFESAACSTLRTSWRSGRPTSWGTPSPWARRGVEFLESLARQAEADRRVRIPTITDPRGIDFCAYRRLRQKDEWAVLERRAIDAMRALGILMTDTCINYQTVSPPVFGEHAAFGDTGVVIYANSVCGARSNFEGGPAAISAGLTGRTPRYGCHLDRHRRGTHLFEVGTRPRNAERVGVARRTGRAGGQLLLARARHRHRRHRRRTDVGRAQALRRGAGKLRVRADVSHDRSHTGVSRPRPRLRPSTRAGPPPRTDRHRRLPPVVRPSRRRRRRGRLRCPATLPGRTAAARGPAARAAHPSGHHRADRHVSREQGGPATGWDSPRLSPTRALSFSRVCASTRCGRERWAKPTGGDGCSPIPPSSSTSSRDTDTIRSSPPWRRAWTRRCGGRYR